MSHRKPRHPTTRRALILLVWIGVVAFGVTPGAYSDESPGSSHELPPKVQDEGPVVVGQRTLVPRAKVIVKLTDLFGWIQLKPPRDPNFGQRRPRAWPLPAQFQSRVPGCVASAVPQTSDIYVISPSPGGHPVGLLRPSTVNTVAFGSIPVTATLQLSQIIDGELKPFHADTWPIVGTSPACDPDFGAQSPLNASTIEGQLSLTITDLQIDGQRIDVGARCRTVKPLEINMWGGDDWKPGLGGHVYQRADDSRVPVPGGYLKHPGSTDLTIPAFTGCVSADGEDISRLLTATISGPGNEIAATQAEPDLSGDRNDPAACYVDSSSGEEICPGNLHPEPPPIPVPSD